VKRKPLDLSGYIFPSTVYFPIPSLVPNQFVFNSTNAEPIPLASLRRLGACSGNGVDQVIAMLGRPPELSDDPDSPEDSINEGGLWLQRFISTQPGGRRWVTWYATVSGLSFKSDKDTVYAEGVDGRIILYSNKDSRWPDGLKARVWAEQKVSPPNMPHPDGKMRLYLFSALIAARNAALPSRTHFRIPAAGSELMGAIPMKPTAGKRRSDREVAVRDDVEQTVFGTKRIGKTVTLKLDDATLKRMYGEKGNSPQGVIRFEAPIEVASDEWEKRATELLKELGTEHQLVAYGALGDSSASNNAPQALSVNRIARMRGNENANSAERRHYAGIAELLSKAIIEVTDPTSKSTLKIPLFRFYGMAKVAGGAEVPTVTVHELIFDTMMAKGHGIFHDQSMLLCNLKTHEQAYRISAALQRQWSFGWVVNKQNTTKPLRRQISVLLVEAGINLDIVAEAKKRGKEATRLRFEGWLDQAKAEGWIGDWKAVRAGKTIAADMYEYTPTEAFRRTLDAHRRPALGK